MSSITSVLLSDDELADAGATKSSDFAVTVDTHQYSSDELRYKLRLAILRLGELDYSAEVFNNLVLVRTVVRSEEIGLEIGHIRARLHAHFTYEIEHAEATPLALGPKQDSEGRGVNQRLQDYFNDALGIDGCYVHARLRERQSRTKNYDRKAAARNGLALLRERVVNFRR